MATETLATPAATADTFPINGTDYIEFWVGNARQASHYYRAAFGFQLAGYRGPETGVRDRASYLLQQDKIRFVFTTPIRPDLSDEARSIADHIYRHGDGVRDLALWVDDAREAYARAMERGAASAMEPRVLRDDQGEVVVAAIHTYGDTIHTLVERRHYEGLFFPGFRPVAPRFQPPSVGLKYVDHCVGNVELGRMDTWVQFYADVMGFRNLLTFDDKDISTEYSALMSKVMANGNDRIKFPINEPAAGKRKSQIDEYLEFYQGPGVQHMALATDDIIATRDGAPRPWRGVPLGAHQLLRGAPGAGRPDRRAGGRPRLARDPGGPGPGRLSAADLHQADRRPPDRVLRDHPAQGRPQLRQGQFQGAVRGDRAGAGGTRQSVMAE